MDGIEYNSSSTATTPKVEAIYHSEGRLYNTSSSATPTWRIEYNIRDHLGNTRILFTPGSTANTVTVLQENHYYPFGLTMDGPWMNNGVIDDNRYLYNGKELVADHGLNWLDYGARWYDPAIGRFGSTDRFAGKYNSISPFQYGANNSVKNIDVNGDSLKINYFDGQNQQQSLYYSLTQQYGYGFYNSNGTIYSGNNEFISQVSYGLARLSLGNSGNQMIDFLTTANQTISIAPGKNSYDPETQTVGFNPKSNSSIPTEEGMSTSKPYISLWHELAHSEDHLKGTLNKSETWIGSGINYSQSEKYATHRENQFRAENGLSLRTHYGVLKDLSNGNQMPDPLSRIIDAKGNSLFYKSINYHQR